MMLVFPRWYNQLGMVYDRFATCQARSFRTPWPVHHLVEYHFSSRGSLFGGNLKLTNQDRG